jgi:hypothetical protein
MSLSIYCIVVVVVIEVGSRGGELIFVVYLHLHFIITLSKEMKSYMLSLFSFILLIENDKSETIRRVIQRAREMERWTKLFDF